jgi:aryl-alcohol dehydrogenase-like predicted oxidoreductase
MRTFRFENRTLSKIFKGNWQLAGGHGYIDHQSAIEDLFEYVEHGVTVFDVGDIYIGVEEIVGEFLKQYGERFGDKANVLRVHTKFVPDLDALETLTRQDIRKVIERSLHRLGVKKLDLVQFHWWDYGKGDYIQAAKYLEELKKEGLIETIGLTNFDYEHTKRLIEEGVSIKSNQIQFSLVDPRPFNGMLEFAKKHNIAIFCYGVLAGGLLAGSQPGDEPTNRSHIKYKLIIDEVGSEYYKTVLSALRDMAARYKTTPATIAITYALQTPGVTSVIVGPRNAKHVKELDQLDNFALSSADYKKLRALEEDLLRTHKDDVYSYERDVTGMHGQIMKYNLNSMHVS